VEFALSFIQVKLYATPTHFQKILCIKFFTNNF